MVGFRLYSSSILCPVLLLRTVMKGNALYGCADLGYGMLASEKILSLDGIEDEESVCHTYRFKELITIKEDSVQ